MPIALSRALQTFFVVLSCGLLTADAADLAQAPADAPHYTLTNLRLEKGAFGSQLHFDFKRVRNNIEEIFIGLNAGSGQIRSLSLSRPVRDSGTMGVEFLGGDIPASAINIEVFLFQKYRISSSEFVEVMISNAIRLGDPGAITSPRPFTQKESDTLKAYNDPLVRRDKHSYSVTVAIPEGTQFVPATAAIKEGTVMSACFLSRWKDVKALSENPDGTINLAWDTWRRAVSRNELVIAKDVLRQLERHPAGKFPETIPNWSSDEAKVAPPASSDANARISRPITLVIPDDWQTVPDKLNVPPGIELRVCDKGQWMTVSSVDENADGTLDTKWDNSGRHSWTYSLFRDQLIIEKSLILKLKRGSVVGKPLKRKDYKVSIRIPRDSIFVPPNAVLKPGTKLQACYTGRWNPITFLSHASDGTLNVHWDDYADAFNCSMLRNQLVIKRSTLRILAREHSARSVRVYTDITGNFRVEASLVGRTGTTVTLLTDRGDEIAIPLAKLSEEDQAFVRSSGIK